MPIVNSVYKSQKLFVSEFLCPICFVTRRYELKPMSNGITFYPIPLLETNEPSHVVECQVCKYAFNPEILERNIQSLFRFAVAAKYRLDQGISPGYLKLQLLSDGLHESYADKIMTLIQPYTVEESSAAQKRAGIATSP